MYIIQFVYLQQERGSEGKRGRGRGTVAKQVKRKQQSKQEEGRVSDQYGILFLVCTSNAVLTTSVLCYDVKESIFRYYIVHK